MQHYAWVAACLALSLASSAGCVADERLPPGPGGTPVGGSGGTEPGDDAGTGSDTGAGEELAGRVCRLGDLRSPVSCTQLANMSGIAVAARGGPSALTAADGSFVLFGVRTEPVTLDIGIDSPDYEHTVVQTLLPDREPGVVLPVVDSASWTDLQQALDIVIPQGTGVIAAYLYDGVLPAQGAYITGTSTAGGIYYNLDGPLDWLPDGVTGPSGAVLIVGVNGPVAELTAIDAQAGRVVVASNIPISPDAITFVDIVF